MKSAFLILVLFSPGVAIGQARPATCEVRPLWSIKGGARSANLGSIGSFQTEGKEGTTVRSYRFPEKNLVITAAIDYEFDYSRKPESAPFRIALAITVSDQPKMDVFESIESSEASTHYSKSWNLGVTKNLFIDDRIWMFTLSCRDGTKPATKASKAAPSDSNLHEDRDLARLRLRLVDAFDLVPR
jgi:hypothetical protein